MPSEQNEPLAEGGLHALVRSQFVKLGTTLNQWCSKNGVCRPYADKCLKGLRNGPKAQALVRKILEGAGIDE